MKLYRFRVKTFANRVVYTQIFAESILSARDLALIQYGENLVSIPEEVKEN